jgi:two-component system OmpR family response regulator
MLLEDQPPLRILVVDDEVDTRAVMREVLEAEGWEVLEAENGATALRLLHAPDAPMIVVLDYLLPDLTGVEVVAHLVAEAPDHLPAVILVTASVEARALHQHPLLAQLNIPILPKPFDIDALASLVKQAAP